MAGKNNKKKYKRIHQHMVKDYEDRTSKMEEKRLRRKEKNEKSFSQKMEEKREQQQRGRLQKKYAAPVVNSKIKKDKLADQFKQLKLDRMANKTDEAMDSDQEEDDAEMNQVRTKSKRRGKAYQKMVKNALKRAAKRPILIKRLMEVD